MAKRKVKVCSRHLQNRNNQDFNILQNLVNFLFFKLQNTSVCLWAKQETVMPISMVHLFCNLRPFLN